MKPDHKAAKIWAEKILALDEIKAQQLELVAFARAYLDLVAQLEQSKADKQRAVELLRRALKQGIRLAFGFAGIVDDDEAMAMHREPEPKQEPKGAQLADLKAAAQSDI